MSEPKGEPRSIFKSLSSFNRVLLLFGLGIPLNGATGKIKVNLRNRIGFLVCLSCSVFCLSIVLSESVFQGFLESEIVGPGWHFTYQLETLLVLPLMLFNYIKRRHVEEFMAKVHEFDETSAQMKWIRAKPHCSRYRNFIGAVLVMSSILLLLLFLLLGILTKQVMEPLAFVRSSVFLCSRYRVLSTHLISIYFRDSQYL